MKRSTLKSKVIAKVKAPVFKEMLNYLKDANPSLWGVEKPQSFLMDNLLVTLYKDLFNVGFKTIEEDLDLGYNLTHHSMETNVPRIRNVLRAWAEQNIQVGTRHEWNAAANNISLPPLISDANLWVDSSDFRLIGKSNHRTRDPDWSFKLNSPAQRYMFVMNAKGKILKIYGGYSPKVYDSDAFALAARDFDSSFHGGVALADSHFGKANNHAPNVKFYVNIPAKKENKKRKRGDESNSQQTSKLTKEQERFNEQHRSGRARVERPFGAFKSKFKSLNQPWQENKRQQDNVVFICAAIHNMNMH